VHAADVLQTHSLTGKKNENITEFIISVSVCWYLERDVTSERVGRSLQVG
jgi:hypothetical protein